MRTFFGIFLSLQILINATEWNEDYKVALETANKCNKDIVLAFVGNDWCPWSQKLQAEVFSQQSFIEKMDDFVLIRIDLSQYQDQSERTLLKEKFEVEEIPSILIVNSKEEKEMARIGYIPLPAVEFANLITEISSKHQEISKAEFNDLEGPKLQEFYFSTLKFGFNEFRYAILTAGLQKDKTPFFLLEKYKLLVEAGKINKKETLDVRKELVKRDPKNEHGVHRTLAVVDFHYRSSKYRLRKKPEEVVKPLIEYINQFGQNDSEHLWKIQMMIAQFYFSRDRLQSAIKYAQASYKVAPEQAKEEIQHSLDFLQSRLNTQGSHILSVP